MTGTDDRAVGAGAADWQHWEASDPARFTALLGAITYRLDGAAMWVRMMPGPSHSNIRDAVHGGALLAFIDVSLFAAARGFGVIVRGTGVTLNLDTQFIGEGRVGEMLEARIELLRETGRLLFLRGLVTQGAGDHLVAAFSGTIRKPPPR